MNPINITNASEIRRDHRFIPYMKNGNLWESTGIVWEITRPVRQGEVVNGDLLMNYRGTLFFAHRMDNPNDIVFNFDHMQKDNKWPDFFESEKVVCIAESENKWRVLWEAIKGLFK